jgi:lipoate-protein ligase B
MEMKFLDWGYIDYIKARTAQEKLVEEKIDGAGTEALIIFTSHESIYTIGRRGKKENIIEADALKRKGLRVLEVNRGGDITYHGPGQLMVYFIFHLSLFDYDVHAMIRWIEGLVIGTLGEYGVEGYRIPQKTGVFCRGKKIASIGLGFRKWVSFHGLALNIDPELNFFSYIRPCGLDIEMTSLSNELGKRVKTAQVRQLFTQHVIASPEPAEGRTLSLTSASGSTHSTCSGQTGSPSRAMSRGSVEPSRDEAILY